MLVVTQEAPFIIVQSLDLEMTARKDEDLGFARASSVIKSFFELPGG